MSVRHDVTSEHVIVDAIELADEMSNVRKRRRNDKTTVGETIVSVGRQRQSSANDLVLEVDENDDLHLFKISNRPVLYPHLNPD